MFGSKKLKDWKIEKLENSSVFEIMLWTLNQVA